MKNKYKKFSIQWGKRAGLSVGGVIGLAIAIMVVFFLLRVLFYLVPYVLIAIAIHYIYKAFISKKINEKQGTYQDTWQNDFNYSSRPKKEPNDPFSYRNKNAKTVVDVEYEDWDDSSESTYKKNGEKKTATYSYNSRLQEQAESSYDDMEFEEIRGNGKAQQTVYVGSINKTIHSDSLKPGESEMVFNCKVGEISLDIDSSIPTLIECKILAGDIKIGKESVSGIKHNIVRRWKPQSPSDKTLKVICNVGFGEIVVRHKKMA